jgi:hypothetical protein
MTTYNERSARVADIAATLFAPDVSVLDVFVDDDDHVCIIIERDDIEHLLIYDDS